jgi:hypothetical protein
MSLDQHRSLANHGGSEIGVAVITKFAPRCSPPGVLDLANGAVWKWTSVPAKSLVKTRHPNNGIEPPFTSTMSTLRRLVPRSPLQTEVSHVRKRAKDRILKR